MKITTKKNSKLDRVSWTQCAVNGLKKLEKLQPLVVLTKMLFGMEMDTRHFC